MDLSGVGRFLLILAVVLALVGVVLLFVGKGARLPGDVAVEGRGWRFYFPIGTSILVSLVLTLLLNLFLRR
jgi:hypothetical protein